MRVFGVAPGLGGSRFLIVSAILGLAGAASLVLSAGRPAHAAFPGQNGRIAFDSDDNGEDNEIWRINADRSGQRPLTDNDDTEYGPAFSPNGRKIAFLSDRNGNDEIFVMRADGSHEHNVSRNDAADTEPFFTPSGKKIVFQSDRDGDDEIYVMRLDGTHVRPLTDNDDQEGAPTVAADGRIAWVRDHRIWVMRADGTHEHPITTDAEDNYPNFSPNGRKITFERHPEPGDDLEIYVMRASGRHARPLTENDYADFAPVFSPDGKKIAWDGGPLSDIRVMRADGTHKHRLTLSASLEEYADWGVKP